MSGVVLITGSGRGIGAATAILAAARGYAVCVNYLSNEERAQKVIDTIRAQGGKAIMVQADTANEAEIDHMFERVDKELGRITALVNNSGITGKSGLLESYDAAAMRRIFDVNVVGTMLCTQRAIQRMSTRHGGQGGSIVNVSSNAAVGGGGGQWLPYAASKGAIHTFTLGLSREVAGEGIRVNGISPGIVATEIHAEAGLGDRLEKVRTQGPMGRIGTPEECAEAILWLMSGEAAYMIGSMLSMTGGR